MLTPSVTNPFLSALAAFNLNVPIKSYSQVTGDAMISKIDSNIKLIHIFLCEIYDYNFVCCDIDRNSDVQHCSLFGGEPNGRFGGG
ncbi:hypothetical protein C9I99_19215 [Photobacterium lutimaris]|uniref:Uncharacterized protein n=1 Tax=Photobacterium lutimaris TaxID=388278 RepID=A0A2T3IV82_9GAMM|nr:hypothetical protein C9I99_19215 [Photobacterium lutimaris]